MNDEIRPREETGAAVGGVIDSNSAFDNTVSTGYKPTSCPIEKHKENFFQMLKADVEDAAEKAWAWLKEEIEKA